MPRGPHRSALVNGSSSAGTVMENWVVSPGWRSRPSGIVTGSDSPDSSVPVNHLVRLSLVTSVDRCTLVTRSTPETAWPVPLVMVPVRVRSWSLCSTSGVMVSMLRVTCLAAASVFWIEAPVVLPLLDAEAGSAEGTVVADGPAGATGAISAESAPGAGFAWAVGRAISGHVTSPARPSRAAKVTIALLRSREPSVVTTFAHRSVALVIHPPPGCPRPRRRYDARWGRPGGGRRPRGRPTRRPRPHGPGRSPWSECR